MSAEFSLIFSTIIPIVGVITSNYLYCSSLLVIRLCRRLRSLGTANPIPWTIGFLNAFSWLIYGAVLRDIFIILGNAMGMVFTVFACTSALKIIGSSTDPDHVSYVAQIENILMAGATVWAVFSFLSILTGIAPTLMGFFCNLTAILLYMAPMSKLLSILRYQDATSIYLPQVFANLINAIMWFLYGMVGINNIFVYVPNMIGIVFGLVQIVIKMCVPSVSVKEQIEGKTMADLSLLEDGSVKGGRSRSPTLLDGIASATNYVQEASSEVVGAVRERSESVMQAVETTLLNALEKGNLLSEDLVSLTATNPTALNSTPRARTGSVEAAYLERPTTPSSTRGVFSTPQSMGIVRMASIQEDRGDGGKHMSVAGFDDFALAPELSRSRGNSISERVASLAEGVRRRAASIVKQDGSGAAGGGGSGGSAATESEYIPLRTDVDH